MRHDFESLFAEVITQITRRAVEQRIPGGKEYGLLVGVGFDFGQQVVEVRADLDPMRSWIRDRREHPFRTEYHFRSIDELPCGSRQAFEPIVANPDHVNLFGRRQGGSFLRVRCVRAVILRRRARFVNAPRHRTNKNSHRVQKHPWLMNLRCFRKQGSRNKSAQLRHRFHKLPELRKLGPAYFVLNLERTSATAALGHVGIVELESALVEPFVPVDRGAFEQQSALFVDNHLHAVILVFVVAIGIEGFVELELIAVSATSTRGCTDPEEHFRLKFLFFANAVDFLRRGRC